MRRGFTYANMYPNKKASYPFLFFVLLFFLLLVALRRATSASLRKSPEHHRKRNITLDRDRGERRERARVLSEEATLYLRPVTPGANQPVFYPLLSIAATGHDRRLGYL